MQADKFYVLRQVSWALERVRKKAAACWSNKPQEQLELQPEANIVSGEVQANV